MKLAGKKAVVTGGGSGIGQGIAVALADEGCQVLIAGRREDKLREVAAGYDGQPPLLICQADVADRKSVELLFAHAGQQLGTIDILVNCAGMNIANRTMADMRPEQWDTILTVNATGAYNCIYAVLPQMRERKGGLIVNVSSVAGKRASRLGGVAYSASKFAMTGLGMSVGQEEAANGIRVTNIYPGEVETPLLEARPVPVTSEHRARMLQPEDLGAAVLMVACLPQRAHVPELVIKPTSQDYA